MIQKEFMVFPGDTQLGSQAPFFEEIMKLVYLKMPQRCPPEASA
jgi:hypothetical protein